MWKLIEYIRSLFRPLDKNKCDKIVSNLDLDQFSGLIGSEIYYNDKLLLIPIITIKLTKNNIYFHLHKDKSEFFTNIGIINLSKKERIYIYQQIELYMVKKSDSYVNDVKKMLLTRFNLTESEFSFLVNNCKDNGK